MKKNVKIIKVRISYVFKVISIFGVAFFAYKTILMSLFLEMRFFAQCFPKKECSKYL